MHTRYRYLFALVAAAAHPLMSGADAATVFPVGPITFSTDADYDNNFKEGASLNLIARDPANNRIRVTGNGVNSNAVTSTAAFDTSATGGSGGNGGTGGADANNDLADFTISSTVNVTNRTPSSSVAYFLRMDDSEAAGYMAILSFDSAGPPSTIRFRLFEGVGTTTTSFGTPIYDSGLVATPTAFNADFDYAVTVNGGQFDFDFNNGALTRSFTDLSLSRTVGQVGIRLSIGGSLTGQTRLDNFTITAIPEPAAGAVMLATTAAALLRRRRRGRHRAG